MNSRLHVWEASVGFPNNSNVFTTETLQTVNESFKFFSLQSGEKRPANIQTHCSRLQLDTFYVRSRLAPDCSRCDLKTNAANI